MGAYGPLPPFMEIDLRNKSYAFAMPCYDGKLHLDTAVGFMETVSYLAKDNISHQIIFNANGSLIDAARNDLVHRFLTKTDKDILVCVDSDVKFDFEGMSRLMALAHKYPIMCGAYPTKETPSKFLINFESRKQNEDGLFPVNSMGMGFVAIQREALERMKPFLDTYFCKSNQELIHAFFRLVIENQVHIGEDIYFFNKAKEAGLQPMLDPYIVLGHIGNKTYDTSFKSLLGEV